MASKPNVFLDLDNTLLSAVPIADMTWDQPTLDLAVEFPFHNMENYYLVFERPGLQEFLDFLFDNFQVSVWSAATKDYVLFIVDRILLQKPNRKLKYILFSYHCDKCKEDRKGSVKLLDFLWDRYKLPGVTPTNTFIIDDNDRVAGFNPNNVVHIEEFEFEDGEKCKSDNQLHCLQKQLQTLLDDYYANGGVVSKDLLLAACSAPDDRRQTAIGYSVHPPERDEGEEEEEEEASEPEPEPSDEQVEVKHRMGPRDEDTTEDDFEKERSFLQDDDDDVKDPVGYHPDDERAPDDNEEVDSRAKEYDTSADTKYTTDGEDHEDNKT